MQAICIVKRQWEDMLTIRLSFENSYHMQKQLIPGRNVIERDSVDQKYERTKRFSYQRACHVRMSQTGHFGAPQPSWNQPASSEQNLYIHIYIYACSYICMYSLPMLNSLYSQGSAAIQSTFPWCFQFSCSLLQITSNISQEMNLLCLQLVMDGP